MCSGPETSLGNAKKPYVIRAFAPGGMPCSLPESPASDLCSLGWLGPLFPVSVTNGIDESPFMEETDNVFLRLAFRSERQGYPFSSGLSPREARLMADVSRATGG